MDCHGPPAHCQCQSQLHFQQLHPALTEEHALGPDIIPQLVEGFFRNEVFEYWQMSDKNWELRCSGAPGSGKTTIAALAARLLREKYTTNYRSAAVASIFLVQDVCANKVTFVEDLLGSIFLQLKAGHTCEGDCNVPKAVAKYVDACEMGLPSATRIRFIREALDECLETLDDAYLVLDGIDRCSPAVELILGDALLHLRLQKLRILTTSRIPSLVTASSEITCDVEVCYNKEEAQTIYWECREPECPKRGFVCLACKKGGASCPGCGRDNLQQPYEYVDFQDSITGEQMIKYFYTCRLEQEHGDLGLGSNPTVSKPPLSRLGAELVEGNSAKEFANRLLYMDSGGSVNIAIARARMDLVDEAPSLEVAQDVGDRLPSSITAMFDAGVRAIKVQPKCQRDLGLRAIAALAYASRPQFQNHPSDGVAFTWLDHVLREATLLDLDPGRVSHRGLEEVLKAAKGFIRATETEVDGAFKVHLYHDSFVTWAAKGYDHALVAAASQLYFGRLGQPKRSQTLAGTTRLSDEPRSGKHANKVREVQVTSVEDTRPPDPPPGGNLRFDAIHESPSSKLCRAATAPLKNA